MKKILKIVLVLLLVGALGFEVYMYFFKSDEDTSVISNTTEKTNKLETKYLADLYSGYTVNGLDFKNQKEDKKVYYKTISGLKDKDIEKKINSTITSKVEELKNNIDSKHILVGSVVSSFENTLSIGFCTYEIYDQEDYDEAYLFGERVCLYNPIFDSLNIDLTTGNDITINDIVNSKDALKEQLTKIGYESLMKSIGIVCGGGPCTNPDPDYSTVEEDLLSLITKYNNDDITFYYTPTNLSIKFKDVSIASPSGCQEGEKDCKKYSRPNIGDIYINQNNRVNEYELTVPLVNVLDNLTIYDKFKTKDSIFEKEGKQVNIKFSEPDDYGSPQMIEDENSLIDYNILFYNSDGETNVSENVKNNLFKEMKPLATENFNIYDVFGNASYIENGDEITYDYVYFDVRHYDMPKNVYLNTKKKIYTEKYNKIIFNDGGYYSTYKVGNKQEYGYEFLKDYLDRKAFFYYVYDDKGKELETEDFISVEYLKSVIPDSWLNLGNYHNKNAMIHDCFVILNPSYSYPDHLVIYDYIHTIELKYKNKSIKLANDDYEKYNLVINQLYK